MEPRNCERLGSFVRRPLSLAAVVSTVDSILSSSFSYSGLSASRAVTRCSDKIVRIFSRVRFYLGNLLIPNRRPHRRRLTVGANFLPRCSSCRLNPNEADGVVSPSKSRPFVDE
jgi:hypothetical protein